MKLNRNDVVFPFAPETCLKKKTKESLQILKEKLIYFAAFALE